MRIFNITLLLNSFKNNKNAKKFLLFINIGIFLSIFAISSAIITFYTETKIDSLEFDLITEHNEKKNFDDLLDDFSELRNTLYSWTKHESDVINLYQHFASTKLGSKLLSISDIYLPILFVDLSSEDSKYLREFFDFFDELMEIADLFYESEDWLPKELDKSIEEIRKHKDLLNKDYSKYYDTIFNYNISPIINDVYYENNKFGIRIENLIMVKKKNQTTFFDELTLAPIDKTLIEKKLLNLNEIKWLNNYHLKVFTSLKGTMFGPSDGALSGSSCVSIKIAPTPTAIAARAK